MGLPAERGGARRVSRPGRGVSRASPSEPVRTLRQRSAGSVLPHVRRKPAHREDQIATGPDIFQPDMAITKGPAGEVAAVVAQ
jgi:hypothetical protein